MFSSFSNNPSFFLCLTVDFYKEKGHSATKNIPTYTWKPDTFFDKDVFSPHYAKPIEIEAHVRPIDS